MVDRNELIDRFGDVEFLHQLWQKARRELPDRLERLSNIASKSEQLGDQELGKQLHKLRGLVSSFLTRSRAIELLVACERELEEGRRQAFEESWAEIRSNLDKESTSLEDFLLQEGFPIPS